MTPTPTPPFRMPAEWEPHAATWLAWPHRRSDWPGKFGPVQWVYAEIVRVIAESERVGVVVQNAGQRAEAERVLTANGVDLSRLDFVQHPTDRGWLRDAGPIFAVDAAGQKLALDFAFTAWAKYDDYALDDGLPASIARFRGVPAVQPIANGKRIVLEGGSIDVNGAGRIRTTEECLLSQVQERNPGLDRAGYERLFAEYLGATETVWLGNGIAGDDTHGHVDDLARFVSGDTVVLASERDESDANYAALRDNRERLASHKLSVVELPMPRPVVFRGTRLPASYANFLITNGGVLVPTFNDPADRVALGILGELFPGREVVGIACRDLVWGLGAVHCMTQQEPVASLQG